MNEELFKQLDYLQIRGLKERWPDLIAHAEKTGLSHEGLLRYVIGQCFDAKTNYAREMRLKRAAIPEMLLMETFPFDRQPSINRKKIMNIYDSLDYMHNHQNIILVGPTGCGKTGLGTGFLVHAIDLKHTGFFITFPELISALFKSMAAHNEDRVLKNFAAYDCLLIDELGYVDVEPAQVGLFFRLMSMRHRRKTTIVTSNLGFSEWTTFLKNDQLTAALIDRLTENSHVINIKNGLSIRPKGLDGDEPKRPRAAAVPAKKTPTP